MVAIVFWPVLIVWLHGSYAHLSGSKRQTPLLIETVMSAQGKVKQGYMQMILSMLLMALTCVLKLSGFLFCQYCLS